MEVVHGDRLLVRTDDGEPTLHPDFAAAVRAYVARQADAGDGEASAESDGG
jgi:hypothetical protein